MRTETQSRLMTAEEFMALPEDSYLGYELVRGRLTKVSEPQPEPYHGSCQFQLIVLLGRFLEANPIAQGFGPGSIVLGRDPDTVRAPDVWIIRNERYPKDYKGGGALFDVAPDLAIEIRSPSDRPSRRNPKIRDYLAAGTTMVWVVEQTARRVTIHTANQPPRVIEGDMRLTGGPVLPGFSCTLNEVFR